MRDLSPTNSGLRDRNSGSSANIARTTRNSSLVEQSALLPPGPALVDDQTSLSAEGAALLGHNLSDISIFGDSRTADPISSTIKVLEDGEQEQEANRLASKNVNAVNGIPSSSPVKRLDDRRVQTSPTLSSSAATPDKRLAEKITKKKGGGESLAEDTRASLEQSFGFDFGQVKVHTDSESDKLSRSLDARAFTVGRDIFFRSGTYNPGALEGRKLLAHELTHVIQQDGGVLQSQSHPDGYVLQRWGLGPFGPGPLVSPSAPAGPSVNDPARLPEAVNLEQLFGLYATNSAEFTIGYLPPTPAQPTYTRDWIQGAGTAAIEQEIMMRLAGVSEEERTNLLRYIARLDPKAYDVNRKELLRQLIAGSLTNAERVELRRVVGDRMNSAYTAFSDAAEAVLRAAKAAAAHQAAMTALVLDVFMGFAVPGLSRGIAALANKLPVAASNTAYRAALAALDEASTKRIFDAATKVGKESVKMYATSLFGEADTDVFVRGLKGAFRRATDAINIDLPNRTDTALGVLAAVYDPSVSTEEEYIRGIQDRVNSFERQILPIGDINTYMTSAGGGYGVGSTIYRELRWVKHSTGEYLALVSYSVVGFSEITLFKTFVTQEFKDLAISRAKQEQRRGIPEIAAKDIKQFPSTIPANVARR